MRRLNMLARYFWAAPATLVGAAFAALAWCAGARSCARDGIIEVVGGRIADALARLPRACRFSAITFGHIVICTDACTADAVRAHERVHVRQYERWGVLFFPLYAGSSLVQWLLGRDPYRDNRFEREAYLQTGEAPWTMR